MDGCFSAGSQFRRPLAAGIQFPAINHASLRADWYDQGGVMGAVSLSEDALKRDQEARQGNVTIPAPAGGTPQTSAAPPPAGGPPCNLNCFPRPIRVGADDLHAVYVRMRKACRQMEAEIKDRMRPGG